MAIRKILQDGDPVLRKLSKPVPKMDARTLQLLDDLAETLLDADGIGLAAPQVGVLKRVAVIDASDAGGKGAEEDEDGGAEEEAEEGAGKEAGGAGKEDASGAGKEAEVSAVGAGEGDRPSATEDPKQGAVGPDGPPPSRKGASGSGQRKRIVELINPEIVERSGTQSFFEGCLSKPGAFGDACRPAQVVVRTLDRSGRTVEYRADGMYAVACCHEIDHLDGLMFMDRVKGPLYTSEEVKELREKQKAKRKQGGGDGGDGSIALVEAAP